MNKISHYLVGAFLIAVAAFAAGQLLPGAGVIVALAGSTGLTVAASRRKARVSAGQLDSDAPLP